MKTKAAQRNCKVFRNKLEIDSNSENFLESPKTLLLHFNEASYTTARTVQFTNVLDFTTHFERLAFGVMRKLVGKGEEEREWTSKEVNFFLSEKIKKKLSDRLTDCLSHSLLSFYFEQAKQPISDQQIDQNYAEIATKLQNLIDQNLISESRVYLIVPHSLSTTYQKNGEKEELKLVTLKANLSNDKVKNENIIEKYEINYEVEGEIIDKIEKEIEIWTYIEPLPFPPPFTSIEIRKHEKRENSDLKSTNWVRDRQQLENLLHSRSHLNITESVLLDPVTNELYEGLSSNFFVVDKSGRVVTADDKHVLVGTIMKIILDICVRLDIEIVRAPPSLSCLSSAKAAFISSTSRLLLPINKIYYPEKEGGEFVFELDEKNEILQRIQNELSSSLLTHSHKIIY